MIKVIGVRFRKAGKVYYFDPAQMEIKMGDHVIVETARGIEFGEVVLGVREVDEKKVIQPLKSVIRMATKNDEELERKNKEKEHEAFQICQEKIRKHKLDMKLIDVVVRSVVIHIYRSLFRFQLRWQKSRTCP